MKERCALLDVIRGLTVVNMVLFHAIWDLVCIFGMNWAWYYDYGAYIWQQCICCTFITLSGFCAGMGKHTLKRGAIVFLLGLAVTLVTLVFMPEDRVIFGVLTLIGSSMLIVGACKSYLKKIPAIVGLLVSYGLFAFTRHADAKYLGIFTKPIFRLPDWLYHNYATAYFGFPQSGFYSTDYFALIPWVFLFLTGFYLYQLMGKKVLSIHWKGIPPLNWIGRHALEIYVVHQPVIYGVLWVMFR